jgi:hypothetical protein
MGVRTIRRALIATAFGSACAAPAWGQNQVIRDDFAGPQISRQNWLTCQRDENEFTLVKAPGRSFRALKALVRPRPDLALFALQSGHVGCASEGGEYQPGDDERAELWEADPIQLRLGTEVWYQFSMFIDPAIRPSHRRLVIGQWKQSGGNSPIGAQRFNGRAFTITIEQDNRSEGRDPQDTQCRVVIAADAAAAMPVGTSNPHFKAPPGIALLDAEGPVPSIGHDDFEVVHGATPSVPALAGAKGCLTDLAVERLGALPSPFGRWTEMRYHLKVNALNDGLLEVWADGQPVVKVTGRIGFEGNRARARQYFKFGPYRDHEAYPVHAMIARFRRGPTLADLE